MKTRYTCALDGRELHALDERIHITDVTEMAPQLRNITADKPGNGLHLLQCVRESLTVRVTFLIREYDIIVRRNVMEKVCAWAAQGGVLTTNGRPGKQLHVRCSAAPGYSALAWLDEMTIAFTAYDIPFWEDEKAVSLTTNGTGSLTVPGTAASCPVMCRVVNQGSGTLYSVALEAGDSFLMLEGIDLAPGADLIVDEVEGRLRIMAGEVSLMHCRSGQSSDRLMGACGQKNTVIVVAEQPVSATFSAKGWYL